MILNAISVRSSLPSWVWLNFMALARIHNNEKDALEVIRDIGQNYNYIFNSTDQNAFKGGLVSAVGCASEHYRADDVMIVYPDVSVYVLNRGAVSYFGERQLHRCLMEHNKFYRPRHVQDVYSNAVAFVHNGEFIIPSVALEKHYPKSLIQDAQALGRYQNKLGPNMLQILSSKAMRAFKNQIEKDHYLT
tara:strand:- start:401 stop:970 length:570 start_codon:yes stop_codon:yes gene_type:complete